VKDIEDWISGIGRWVAGQLPYDPNLRNVQALLGTQKSHGSHGAGHDFGVRSTSVDNSDRQSEIVDFD
jgi:hypothetical protein